MRYMELLDGKNTVEDEKEDLTEEERRILKEYNYEEVRKKFPSLSQTDFLQARNVLDRRRGLLRKIAKTE